MISAATFLVVEMVASAVLALWVLVRFPRLGPKSLRTALVVGLVALGGMRVSAAAASFVVRLPHGAYGVLLGCALPGFFASFLAAAWLLRVCAGMVGGSGGGPGEPVSSRSY
jgi:hypothetical protein